MFFLRKKKSKSKIKILIYTIILNVISTFKTKIKHKQLKNNDLINKKSGMVNKN